jgi:hypothetical protein
LVIILKGLIVITLHNRKKKVKIAEFNDRTPKEEILLERGTFEPFGNNFQHASLHFRFCEKRAELSVALLYNPTNTK